MQLCLNIFKHASPWKNLEDDTHWPTKLKIPTKLLTPTELCMNVEFSNMLNKALL